MSADEGLALISELSYLVHTDVHGTPGRSPLAAQASLHVSVERTLRKELQASRESFQYMVEDIRERGYALLQSASSQIAELQDALGSSRLDSRNLQLTQPSLHWRVFIVRDCISHFDTLATAVPYIRGIDTVLIDIVKQFVESPFPGQLISTDAVFCRKFKERILLRRQYDTFALITKYLDDLAQSTYRRLEPITEHIEELEEALRDLRHYHDYISHIIESVSEQ